MSNIVPPPGGGGTVTANQGTAAAVSGAWPAKITDGTNTATVTAGGLLNVSASAAPPADTVGTTAALGALNAVAQVTLAGQSGAGLFLAAGTLIGTIVPELSYDGGTTWVSTLFYDPATQTTSANLVFSVANGATTRTILTGGGTSHVRVRVSAFTSGTANATIRGTGTQGGVAVTATQGAPTNWLVDVIDRAARLLGIVKVVDTAGVNQLAITAANAAKVDGSAVTQPVSGTVTAGQGTAAAVAGAWPGKVTDGTNVAAVKAASIAAVSADPSLVVALSPNSPSPARADLVGTTGALGALDATVSLAIAGQQGVGMFLAAGTFIGTIVPELSYDGGTTWTGTVFYDPSVQTTSGSSTFTVANTAELLTVLTGGGASHARVRVSAFTSGTANATLRGTTAQGGLAVVASQGAASGVAWPVSGTVTANQGTAGTAGWPIQRYTADTTSVFGTATAPLAGGVVATITPGAGSFEVVVLPAYGATADVLNNMQLQVGATVIGRLFVPNAVNGTPLQQTFRRLTVAAATAITVNAIVAGAVGSVYNAMIFLSPVT